MGCFFLLKPNVFTLNTGGMNSKKSEFLGENSYRVSTTVGLIEYFKEGKKKYMLVDPGIIADWSKIEKNLKNFCELRDVSHVLVTHWDQDHAQNLHKFPNAVAMCGIGTNLVGTNKFGFNESLYPEGFIEEKNIRYKAVRFAHSRDDMLYLVDSKNYGVCAFVGDLIFGSLEEYPIKEVIQFDLLATINPIKKYLTLKELQKENPELKRVFPGHGKPLNRKKFNKLIEEMKKPLYQSYLREFLGKWKQRIKEYEKVIK